MDNSRLKDILSMQDRAVLDARADVSWIPQNPRELLLPYIEKAPVEDLSSIEARRKKAKEVYDKYGQIEAECKRIGDEISERCKDATIPLDPMKHANTITALRRVFGVSDVTQITFDMYKQVVQAFAKLGNQSVPTPKF